MNIVKRGNIRVYSFIIITEYCAVNLNNELSNAAKCLSFPIFFQSNKSENLFLRILEIDRSILETKYLCE